MQIRPTSASSSSYSRWSGEISAIFGEIRWDPSWFRRYLVRFGGISTDHSWWIQRDSRRSKWDLDHILWDPTRLEEIQVDFNDFWCSLVIFADSGDFFEDSGDICRIRRLSPSTEPNRTPPEPNLTDWHRRSISGPFGFHLTLVGRVRAGSKTDSAWPVDSLNSQSLSLFLCLSSVVSPHYRTLSPPLLIVTHNLSLSTSP